MFKTATLVFFHAETGLHAGSGQALGAVDLAIQRERHTHFPVIAASGVKGALRDWFYRKYPPQEDAEGKKQPHPKVLAAFGPETTGPETTNADAHAGAVAFTDARTLLFPVRSASGVFAWTTCPAVLARLGRDLTLDPKLAETLDPLPDIPKPEPEEALGGTTCRVKDEVEDKESVLLEEYALSFRKDEAVQKKVDELAKWLREHAFPQKPKPPDDGKPELPDPYKFWRERLATHLLVLPDDLFTDFVRHATEVQARIKLKSDTKTVDNLFYQENLPADTVLYAAVLATKDLRPIENGKLSADVLLDFVRELDGQRLQLGGDETVGKGICCARFLPPKS